MEVIQNRSDSSKATPSMNGGGDDLRLNVFAVAYNIKIGPDAT
jgi:hypothetical protein